MYEYVKSITPDGRTFYLRFDVNHIGHSNPVFASHEENQLMMRNNVFGKYKVIVKHGQVVDWTDKVGTDLVSKHLH